MSREGPQNERECGVKRSYILHHIYIYGVKRWFYIAGLSSVNHRQPDFSFPVLEKLHFRT